jgi:hypothetical protein
MRLQIPGSITLVALALLIAAATPTHAVDLDSLLTKSLGGPEGVQALQETKTLYLAGGLNLNGMQGRIETYFAMPDRILVRADFGMLALTQGYDGTVAWSMDHNGAVTELSGYQKQELLNQAYLQSATYLFPDRQPGSLEYIGLVERGNETFHHVNFYPFDADTVRAYFDTTTAYLEQIVTFLDNLEMVTVLSDFRESDGGVMAFKAVSEAIGAPLKTVTTYDVVVADTTFDPSIFSRPDKAVDDFRFPADRDSVVVSFVLDHGHIYLPVTINGKKRVRLILDSGASANIYQSSILDDLNLDVVGTLPAKGVAGYGEVDLLKTDSLLIGDLVLLDQVGGAMDLSGIGREVDGDPFGGVLGYDFLSRFPIRIDYQAQTLTLYEPSKFTAPDGGLEVSFRMTMNIPTVTATLNDISGEFIVDLGNAYGILVHDDFFRRSGLAEQVTLDSTRRVKMGGVGGSVSNQAADVQSFGVGNLKTGQTEILITGSGSGLAGSTEIAGNIGNQFWRSFGVLLDYSRSRLLIYRSAADQE